MAFTQRHNDKYLKNVVSKSIHVIKHANFQLPRVQPDSYLENLSTDEKSIYKQKFDFLFIKCCIYLKRVEKKKLLGRQNVHIFAKWLFDYLKNNAEIATKGVL